MREVLITSSVLILALLFLRLCFKNSISRRVQYALWALVLVRLLVPVSLPPMSLSVLNAGQQVQAAVTGTMARQVTFLPTVQAPAVSPSAGPPVQADAQPAQGDVAPAPAEQESQPTAPAFRLTVGELLFLIWAAGAASMACFFLVTNLRFWRLLRRGRRPFPVRGCRRPVYLCDGLPSPCLFGLFRPAIYLSPGVAAFPHNLSHVIAHEETHARHLDPLWSLLRCLCLTLYWFDPLVWAAAAASRTDCELACDEGALRRLGDGERLAYGQTLLSMVPVRSTPANPLLTATTMTAGKRQLKDRISRIAQRHKNAAAAVCAATALALAVSACTFSVAKPEQSGGLTGEELAYFNETYFNGGDAGSGDINIRNEFLSSVYEKPEDIDLFQLFYCGIPETEGGPAGYGFSSAEENQLVYGQPELECPAYKLTAAQMDALLGKYTGLTVAETAKVGLDQFTYLADQDAYYWAHGDTGGFTGGGWMVLTLERQDDGGYHFISNQPGERPAIPPALPVGEPELTIPLSDLTPYEAPPVTVTPHGDDFSGSYEDRLENWDIEGRIVQVYRAGDGLIYAAVVAEDGTRNVFHSDLNEDCRMFFFHDLFGHSGFSLSYFGQYDEHSGGTITDYYYFGTDDTPILLARVNTYAGESLVLDLDGDGESELAGERQLFFQRDGSVYEANLPALLAGAWSGIDFWDYSSWDQNTRCLTVTGLTQPQGDRGNSKTFWRDIYFSGGELLVYKDRRTAADHVMEDIDAPAGIIDQAKAYVLSLLEPQSDGTWLPAGRDDSGGPREIYDDWRVESLSGPYRCQVAGLTVDAYSFNYECHTTTPERVILAGGKYLSEDDWVSPGYPGCDWLFFLVNSNSGPTYLYHDMINDMSPDSVMFQASIQEHLRDLGLLQAAQTAQEVLNAAVSGHRAALTLAPADGVGGGRYETPAAEGNGPNRVLGFADSFAWAPLELEEAPEARQASSLTVAAPDGSASLQCWEDSEEVLCTQNGDTFWLTAGNLGSDAIFDGTIFSYLRLWYDEVELAGLREGIVIPNDGRSQAEIAQAWVDAYDEAMLRATPGSGYACAYVKSTVELEAEMPEGWFPADILDKEHFAFSFATVFVPENQRAAHMLMAGNTAEHEGDDAPAGALEYWRKGSMYLDDTGWLCAGIGTG